MITLKIDFSFPIFDISKVLMLNTYHAKSFMSTGSVINWVTIFTFNWPPLQNSNMAENVGTGAEVKSSNQDSKNNVATF